MDSNLSATTLAIPYLMRRSLDPGGNHTRNPIPDEKVPHGLHPGGSHTRNLLESHSLLINRTYNKLLVENM